MNSKLIQGLTDELDTYWMGLVEDLKASLVKEDRYASGNTAQSIGEYNTNPISITAQGIKVTLGMPDHYIYLDRGVNGALSSRGALPTEDGKVFSYKKGGKMPPLEAIRQFMRNRGIDKLKEAEATTEAPTVRKARAKRSVDKTREANTTSGKKRTKDDELNSIAFVIARSIFEKGTKPTKFYSNVMNDKTMLALENRLMAKFGNLIVDIVKIK
tara:strand:+ start:387 stop:1028 length:642 start_codon:yes stop_codon:yes gene_type:complete